jgi:hypothetical protein
MQDEQEVKLTQEQQAAVDKELDRQAGPPETVKEAEPVQTPQPTQEQEGPPKATLTVRRSDLRHSAREMPLEQIVLSDVADLRAVRAAGSVAFVDVDGKQKVLR